MNHKRRILISSASALTMLILILDAKTAFNGALDGIKMCIYSVVPALFPLIFLSFLVRSGIHEISFRMLNPIKKLCKLPIGGETLFLLGILSGYPVGAQSIAEAYKCGQLDKSTAKRMLAFCNNAGPAFIFGIISKLFTSAYTVWLLWLVHILSAIIVGIILPGKHCNEIRLPKGNSLTIQKAIIKSIGTIATICGWVILSRVLIAICMRWFLWLLPQLAQISIIGAIEMTNGFHELANIENEALRFIISACFLSFGGLCVTMQTLSVADHLSIGMYIPGKLLQLITSLLLASIFSVFISVGESRSLLMFSTFFIVAFVAIFNFSTKK